jgi:hypothetical protein
VGSNWWGVSLTLETVAGDQLVIAGCGEEVSVPLPGPSRPRATAVEESGVVTWSSDPVATSSITSRGDSYAGEAVTARGSGSFEIGPEDRYVSVTRWPARSSTRPSSAPSRLVGQRQPADHRVIAAIRRRGSLCRQQAGAQVRPPRMAAAAAQVEAVERRPVADALGDGADQRLIEPVLAVVYALPPTSP